MSKSYTEKNFFWVLLFAFMLPLCSMFAQNIRVVGKVVTNDSARVPIPGVMVVDPKSETYLTETDGEGMFRINCDPKAKIRFQSIEIEPKTIKIDGRTNIVVEVQSRENILREVLVKADGHLKDTIRIEPGDVIQMGDKFYINAVMKLGEAMFNSDKRLVAQAILYNFTKKNAYLMPPMVIDGAKYGMTQRRMYGRLAKDESLKDSGDPIGKYSRPLQKDSIVGKGKQRSYQIVYRDSVATVVGKKDFIRCDIAFTVENYKKVSTAVSQNYVEGVINPLRFLENTFAGSIVTDSLYFPRPELQMCDSKGQINLQFAIGKTNLDMSNAQNRAEMDKLEKQLRNIAKTPGSSIKSFRIIGTSSPDGRYDVNLNLAQGRMASARNLIMSKLDSDTRMGMHSAVRAVVAPWDSVVSMLRADSLSSEAEAIAKIVRENSSHDVQSSLVRNLPFFGTLLREKYLPRLRKVEYEITYDVRRVLTVPEIAKIYKLDPQNLSKYEYFRLFRAAESDEEKESICRDALRIHPKFWMAANDLQEILIRQKRSDDKLLAPFVKAKAHQSLLTNHVIALLEANRYTAADSAASYLRKTPENAMVLAIVGVNNNRIKANYETVEKSSARNKVLMCLYMNRNQEAFDACKRLEDDDAFTHYLYATCYKRMRKEDDAIASLNKAFKMDAMLEEYAKVDGDLRKLYKKIKKIK